MTRTRHQRKLEEEQEQEQEQAYPKRKESRSSSSAASGPMEREFDGLTHHWNDSFFCVWRSSGDAMIQDLTQYRELTHGKSKKRGPPGSSSSSSPTASAPLESNTVIKLHLLCGSWIEHTDYGDDGPSIKRQLANILFQLHQELSALHKKLKIRYETGIICVDDQENEDTLQVLLGENSGGGNKPSSASGPSSYALSNLPLDVLPSLVLTMQQPTQRMNRHTPSTHKSIIRFMESWAGQDLLEFLNCHDADDLMSDNYDENDDDKQGEMDGAGDDNGIDNSIANDAKNNDNQCGKSNEVPFEFIAEFMSSIVESTSRSFKEENSNGVGNGMNGAFNRPKVGTFKLEPSVAAQMPKSVSVVSMTTRAQEISATAVEAKLECTEAPMDVTGTLLKSKKRPMEATEPQYEAPTQAIKQEGEASVHASASAAASNTSSPAVRIFVAGDRMSVGKSSVCLGILGTLINKMGYTADSLAYIKPATQNESPQPVQVYCEAEGIACVPVGPIVYYRGFTRAFLAGTTDSTDELLARVRNAVDELAADKRVVVIDGVGFPAVGSICGTDNASVALASGYPTEDGDRNPPAVVVVGGGGVGGAVDAFNLNATYFEMRRIPVIGVIFNKLDPDESSFYSLRNCEEQITSYFSQNQHQRAMGRAPFGFVPMGPKMTVREPSEAALDGKSDGGGAAADSIGSFLTSFAERVDVPALMEAAEAVQRQAHPGCAPRGTVDDNEGSIRVDDRATKRVKVESDQRLTKTREEIEQAAIRAGAAPSA